MICLISANSMTCASGGYASALLEFMAIDDRRVTGSIVFGITDQFYLTRRFRLEGSLVLTNRWSLAAPTRIQNTTFNTRLTIAAHASQKSAPINIAKNFHIHPGLKLV